MRCLYCGEPLSLLRKLTGKAEFCSEAHREAYQEEFNSLALQRLASHPKSGRRPEPLSAVAPLSSPAAADLPASAFDGLPNPEDTQDTDEIFELPVFDSPIFTGVAAANFEAAPAPLANPEVKSPEVDAPAQIWALFSNPLPSPSGETPATYSFSLALADYPRVCLIEPSAFSMLAKPETPFAGYVDLPELLDEPVTEVLLPGQAFAVSQSGPAWPRPDLARAPLPTGELFADELLLSFAIAASRPSPPVVTLLEREPFAIHPSAATLLTAFTTPAGSSIEPSFAPFAELSPAAEDSAFAGSPAADDPLTVTTLCETFDAERSLVPPSIGELSFHAALPLAAALATSSLADMPLGAAHSPNPEADSVQHLETGSEFHQLWNVPSFRSVPRTSLAPAAHVDASPPAFASPFAERSLCSTTIPWPAAAPTLPIARAAAAAVGESCAGIAVLADWIDPATPPSAHGAPPPASVGDMPLEGDWMSFNASEELSVPVSLPAPVALALGRAGFESLDGELTGSRPSAPSLPPQAPSVWPSVVAPRPEFKLPPLAASSTSTALSKVRVKDFAWPDFAAGCESLFTPDQPFRFHEMPFAHRGTTELLAGGILTGEIMSGLSLRFADDRFESVLRPPMEPQVIETWLAESASTPSKWAHPGSSSFVPSIAPSISPTAAPAKPSPAEPSPNAAQCPTPSTKPSPARPIAGQSSADPQPPQAPPAPAPPASWQQAARAMYEGEQQQLPRDAQPPASEQPPVAAPQAPSAVPESKPFATAKPVNAVPITDPLRGTEVARVAPAAPPTPFIRQSPMPAGDSHQPPANEDPQFEWRRQPPNQAPPRGQEGGGPSTVSLNTTITVEGNTGGIVVESAVRISLGDRANPKKKSDAVERFSEGQDLGDSKIHLAAPEGLPEFVAEPAELRAILQPVVPPADSIQWPKFSVTPMRRRVAFGPARGGLFGSPSPASAPKHPSETKTLPPKKSVGGFLFKKLTNS